MTQLDHNIEQFITFKIRYGVLMPKLISVEKGYLERPKLSFNSICTWQPWYEPSIVWKGGWGVGF